ncbi:PAS domain S-box protein [Ekhidna sp.]|uniref:PAS domain S-box protein n=3 Tax=Ekhidna sp. TaxID=2608089 RepID=UPI00329766C5
MEKQAGIIHKHVLDNMPFGVIQVDLQGVVIYVNKSARSLLKVGKEKPVLGVHYSKFVWFEFDEFGKPITDEDHILTSVFKDQSIIISATQGVKINGKTRWFSVNAAPAYDENEKFIGGISNFVDITDKIENKRKKQEESDRFKILVENINAVVWESSFGTKSFTYISPKIETLLGFSTDEWLKEGFWQSRIDERDKQHVISYESQKARDVENYQLEYRIVSKGGELVWIRDMVEVVRDGEEPVMLRGLMVDITEKKNARSLLKESEQRYRQLISEAPYAITIYDRQGVLIAANSKCEEYWMVDLKSYIGVFNIFENDLFTKDSQLEEIKKAFVGESGELTTSINLTHADLTKTFKLKYYPLFDSNGELENVIYITEDITEYIQAEENTKQEESLKQGILDALDEAILVIDHKGEVINVNKRLKLYVREKPYSTLATGQSIFDFISLLDEEDYLKKGLESILNQEVKVLDHEIKMADGKWYNIRATPLNEPFGAVITWQNINTRKEIEMALEKSLRKYRNIYNKAPVMMHSINEKLEIISVSDFWLEKMGFERNEVIGKSPFAFLSEESAKQVPPNLEKLFTDGFVRNIEYTFRKKDGGQMDVLLSAVAEYDEEGNFERSITGMLDVTDLKKAERKLQESQSKLLESQRISKIANYEFDIATGIFNPSEEMVSMMGFSETNRHVSVIEDLIHPEDLTEFQQKLEKSILEARDFFHIYRINHLKSKTLKWISGRGRMIKDDEGKVVKMIGTVQDISEQKHAEQRIRKLSDRVLLATEIANLGVWEYDRDKNEIFWEDQMYSIFEQKNQPLSLLELRKYFSDEHQGVIDSSLQLIKKGINFLESEVQIHLESGDKYLRAFTRVLRDQKNRVKGMVGVVYDISVDKGLQKKLETSLEEKNILIKEVHHRVKNNMQLISSILALKSYELDSEKSKQVFEEINDRIKAMAVIHDKLYTFYNVSEIDIREYLMHIANELHIILSSSRFTVEVKAEQVIFDVEKALLIGLIVSEMVGNAVKHGFRNITDGVVTIFFEKEGEGHVLKVLNNGDEMDSDVLSKETGLGISLIKTFAKQLGGELSIESKKGFKVCF